jgi:Domain of Unknown Function (DUF349)
MGFIHLMKPLSRFFRSHPTAPTLATQVAVLDSAAPAELGAAAMGDGTEALRIAAIRKLTDGEILRGLAGLREGADPGSPTLERAAQERLAQLIDAGTIDLADLSAAPVNFSALLSVAGLCSDPARLPMALALVNDPQRVARLVIDGSSVRIRQLAAQSLEDPAELRLLLKQVRGSDKSIYKIVKQKCDVLRAEERRIAQIESDVNALCATLERHSHRIYDPLYPPSLEQFEARWRALEAQAAPELRERAQRAIEGCREVIARHHHQLAEQAQAVLQKAALRAARDEATVQAAEQAQRHSDELAAAAAEAAQAREAEETARAEKSAAEALALRQLGGLIGKANGALRDGITGRAARLRHAIEEKLPALPALPAYLASQVQQLDLKLNELKEWKDYAVAPKRTELIEEMEALIGSTYKPRVLADRIKQLQDDWKTISKGIISDSEADWQRFQQASVTAYQPCREYFETQAKQRHANLEQRKGVLARLQAFESAQAEHPDWRAVAAVLREAPEELHRYFPVDRAASRAVQEEFDASLLRLQARLDAWYAENAEAKRALIQRAQHLRGSQDSREAVDGVKRLQLKWKEVGAAERDVERRLWEEFRENCDAVFQKRQQVHAEYSAGLEASKAQAVALCEEAEQLAARSGAALLEGAGMMAQWRTAFESLGEMPRADQRALHDRFERALQRCQAQLAKHRTQEKERSFTHLLEAAGHIQAYGWAVAQDAAAADREALKQFAEAFMASVQQWPKGGAQALKEAWAKSEAGAKLELAAQEAALRMLCIRAEIITDRPTPPEDHPLRREYQVQRLVQRMVRNESPDELDALTLAWARVGPVSAVALAPLLARFLRCREQSTNDQPHTSA